MQRTSSHSERTIADMAAAALERGYEYIAITDHSKGLKIAGSIDEQQLLRQADEIAEVNAQLRKSEHRLTVLRSVELNLNQRGKGDMAPSCFPDWNLFSAASILRCGRKKTTHSAISQH